ncbi:MAG: hypothetical protein Hyperionvirus21_6 [Hyperionvirus sp.]|uniref:Fatty acid desaturase domain-containing protein n=1 Tax=Hyperionvirus sp. TaxID=2487770 RepID=A0A3G5AAX6_9VIRU|nr:MAG: hypothetical protein Hyperionvirus21_6 [Hyperionvirus sp.]
MAYFCPQTALYFYGYELGALILPIAHGWQHISHTLVPPPVRVLFFIFEFIGIVANKDDHGRHHVHTTPTVYQAFTSSGIFNAKLDHFVDILWDMAYNEAARNPSQTKPYDIINPWVKGIQIFCLAIMPFIVPYFYVPACCYLAIHLLRIPPPFVSAIVLNILYYAYFA